MLGVPAVLIGDNSYYEQKAAGILEDFGLPAAFGCPGTADAAVRAGEIAAVLFDVERDRALRDGLAAAAERLRRRRAATEVEVLSRLASGVVVALDERLSEARGRIGQLAAEPAKLHARAAAMQSELERLRHLVEESPLGAERRAQEAEARAAAAHETLDGVLRSRSWRLLAPLRRLKALLRRG